MNKLRLIPYTNRGFTLTELSIVLVIAALLISGMMIPISAQRDIQNISETGKRMNEIKEALLGFAVLYGRLPCQSSTIDPTDPKYGVENSPCDDAEGYLPWKTLGVGEIDAWGTPRTAAGDPFRGYWRYRVVKEYAAAFALPAPPASPPASALVVQDASGNNLTTANPDGPIAIVYSTGPDLTPNGQNATIDATFQAGERAVGFDDMLVWISRPILFNRMIAAGKLP